MKRKIDAAFSVATARQEFFGLPNASPNGPGGALLSRAEAGVNFSNAA